MAIYNIFEAEQAEEQGDLFEEVLPADKGESVEEVQPSKRDRFFSSLVSRLFFLVLLIGDLLWCLYSTALLLLCSALSLATFFKVQTFSALRTKFWISFKRSLVCGLALLVALFCPSFGIMVACTYFMMYDKGAIEEIVPASIQEQFKILFAAT